MKKLKHLLTAVALLATLQSSAQLGGNLNIGVGLGSNFVASGASTSIPPVSLSYEHGISKHISIGGLVGYAGASVDFPALGGTWKYKYSYILVGARASYHFLVKVPKLDPYAGVIVGYNVGSVTTEAPAGYTGPFTPPSVSAGGVLVGGHIGARYMFANKIGAFAEAGYGVSYLTLGLAFKF
jgi:hypothetical protein